jgi:uncharacterized phage protein (TIGR02218 family)
VKTAKFETSVGALAAFLASRPQGAFACDLYTFNLVGSLNSGNPLVYTTADVPVNVPYAVPVTYLASDVQFDQLQNKSYGHWKIGLDVDTWQVITTPKFPNPANGFAGSTIGGNFYLSALRAGVLDGAVVQVDRAFFNNQTVRMASTGGAISPLGVVNIFTGRVAEVDLGRTNAVISINSHLELLDVNMPRNLFQAGCRWTLFDSGCTLKASSYAKTGTAAAAATSNTFTSSITAPAGSGTYALGRVSFTSGQNAGFSRSVRSWVPGSPGTFTLMTPFPFPIASGDAFTAYPGCSRLQGTCQLFGNLANFGGESYIPAPESAT